MTTFIFGNQSDRTPLEISSWPGYITQIARDRIKQALMTGCYCCHAGSRTATLTLRNGGVWLQCDACGSSLGTAMKRVDHRESAAYPNWRVDLIEQYDAARAAWASSLPTVADEKQAREAEYIIRSQEYELWCRASPEWAEIKKRIVWRSRGHCEACLAGNADVVHHLTYGFGKLPPAWHLRAVCVPCHTRLHARDDDWCDYGMARGS